MGEESVAPTSTVVPIAVPTLGTRRLLEFKNSDQPKIFIGQLERRREVTPARGPTLSWLFAGAGALVMASVAILTLPQWYALQDGVRTKGGVVEVYSKRALANPIRVLEGAELKPGDTLRFRHRGEHRAHILVIEQDSAGSLTVFAPFGGAHSVVVSGDDFLPDAVALDRPLGKSSLITIHSATQFELAPLMEALRSPRQPQCQLHGGPFHFEKVP